VCQNGERERGREGERERGREREGERGPSFAQYNQ